MATVRSSTTVTRDHPRVAALLERLPTDSEPRQALDSFFAWAGDRTLDGITAHDLEGWRDHISRDGAKRRDDHVISRWLFALGYFYDDLKEEGLVRRNPASELIGPLFYGYRGELAAFTKKEVRRLIKPPPSRAGIRDLRDFLICAFSLAFGDRAKALTEITIESMENTTKPLELTRLRRRYLELYRPRPADKFLFPQMSGDHRHPLIDGSLKMSVEGIRQAMRRHAKNRKVEELSAPGVKEPSGAERFIATHYLYFRGGRFDERPPGVASLARSLE